MKISVATTLPNFKADQLTAYIELDDSPALALKSSVKSHPGWKDVQRRKKAGVITSPYITASSPQMLYLPGKVAKYYNDHEKVKTLAAKAWETAVERKLGSLVFLLNGSRGDEHAECVAEGLAFAAYSFDKYKLGADKKTKSPSVTLVVNSKKATAIRRQIKETLSICESVSRARDLVNEPGSVATPAEIEAQARAVAKRTKLKIKVLDKNQLQKEGYEGLITVGRGGPVPPRMIVLQYRPKNAKKCVHLGFLGKGLTFDTGGISIKPGANMWQMKGDMAGGAAVLFGMEAIANLKPNVKVTAIICTSQNYVDENSMLPGDIIRGRNGKTIHIDNTDAEGRLILTDGLWRAGEEKVTHLVDFATLTGAIVRALGDGLSGAFGNGDVVDTFMEVAEEAGEPCWKMPLVEEYVELLKCDVADVNNIGGAKAGAITAALFLREFLPEGIDWAHIDIAGQFLYTSPKKYYAPGATGIMVRSIAAMAQRMAK